MDPRFLLVLSGLMPGIGLAAVDSHEKGSVHADEALRESPSPSHPLVTEPGPAGQRSPFFTDSKVSAQLRTYYLYRDNFDSSKNEAWAIGGSASFLSGYAANIVRIGAVAYTSQPLYAPDDRDGTTLLAPGQEGYTVLGQSYAEIKLTDHLFSAIGRKDYNTPYINPDDSDMSPNTFQGVTLYGANSSDNRGTAVWRYGGGYISKIKEQNSDRFIPMSAAAGASVDRGVYGVGLSYKQNDFTLGLFEYLSRDIINIVYGEVNYSLPMDGKALKLSAQYADQRSNGDDLLTGSEFSTNQWGVKADLRLGEALVTMAYTDTAKGSDMVSPWGGYPGYTSVQVEDFDRAGEKALMIRGAYDFSNVGLQGISGYALWVHGSGVDAPLYNQDEVDFDLQWKPDNSSVLRGMSFRVRYARVMQDGGGDPDTNEFRIIVNYDFPRP